MASVQTRARASKSSAKLKCPKCGGPLTVVRDTPDQTNLQCGQCSKRNTGEWLATEGAYKAVRAAARKHRGLSLSDLDDLVSELVVHLLEHECPLNPGAEGFTEWLDRQSYIVAGKLRDFSLNEHAKPMDTDVMAATVVEDVDDDADYPFANASDMQKYLEARRQRIRRVLVKLSTVQQKAIRLRYFSKGNLAEVAREGGKCDSSERMNLLRGCRRLKELIDNNGYAVAT